MQALQRRLKGLIVIEPNFHRDDRGLFFESFRKNEYQEAGITCDFVQDNHSDSTQNTIRGLHYQDNPGQAKLVRVIQGRIFDVAVDIRPDSETFGQWEGVYLDDVSHRQFFIPNGFAHGFCVMSERAIVHYKISSYYLQQNECGFSWNDPDVGINWPIENPILSKRDQESESFASLKARLIAP